MCFTAMGNVVPLDTPLRRRMLIGDGAVDLFAQVRQIVVLAGDALAVAAVAFVARGGFATAQAAGVHELLSGLALAAWLAGCALAGVASVRCGRALDVARSYAASGGELDERFPRAA